MSDEQKYKRMYVFALIAILLALISYSTASSIQSGINGTNGTNGTGNHSQLTNLEWSLANHTMDDDINFITSKSIFNVSYIGTPCGASIICSYIQFNGTSPDLTVDIGSNNGAGTNTHVVVNPNNITFIKDGIEKMAINSSGDITTNTNMNMQNYSIINAKFPNSSFQRQFYPYRGYVKQGTWTWVTGANQIYGGLFGSSAPASTKDEYYWNFKMPEGNYSLSYTTLTTSNRAIMETRINTSSGTSTLLKSDDQYSASTVYNLYRSVNFSISNEFDGKLVIQTDGKNTSSTAYYVGFSDMVIESRS